MGNNNHKSPSLRWIQSKFAKDNLRLAGKGLKPYNGFIEC